MGLGLYLVRTILQLHGGDIGVSSVQGQYTRFEFYLPKRKEPPKLKEPAPPRGKEPKTPARKESRHKGRETQPREAQPREGQPPLEPPQAPVGEAPKEPEGKE